MFSYGFDLIDNEVGIITSKLLKRRFLNSLFYSYQPLFSIEFIKLWKLDDEISELFIDSMDESSGRQTSCCKIKT